MAKPKAEGSPWKFRPQLPADLVEILTELANKHSRSVTMECVVGLRHWMETCRAEEEAAEEARLIEEFRRQRMRGKDRGRDGDG